MSKIIFIVLLVLCSLHSAMTLAESADTKQLQMLDRLHQAGLISDALHDRRRQLIDSGYLSSAHLHRDENRSEISIATDKGRYKALVIGSNDYQYFEPLETAVNDAKAVAKILQEKFKFEVQLLENPDRQALIGSLASLRQTLSAEDKLLLYYAGHGVLDNVTDRGYWLPTDAERDNPANWVSTAEINDALLSLQSHQVLVIADSCYSGSLTGNSASSLETSSNISVSRNSNRTDNSRRPKISRTVITSGGLEPVLDSIDGVHSVFARALLEQLENHQAGSSIASLYQQVSLRVKRESDQSPGYYRLREAGHQSGEFIFPSPEQ